MDRRIIRQLNEIRSSEQRMAILYRRCAEQVIGPYRNALADEFTEHAVDEDHHAASAQRHIIALGGDLDTDVKEIPNWRSLQEMLVGLEQLEEKGIRLWQELMRMLPPDDAYRHTVEENLSKEQEHWDDVRRMLRDDFAEKSLMKTTGDIGSLVPLNLGQRRGLAPSAVQKAESFAQQVERASRAGTPPTRRGMFNGAMPATEPGIPAELNPPLLLGKSMARLPDGSGAFTGTVGKAVVDPAMAGGRAGDSVSRKRDSSTGRFAAAQQAGQQSTAEEDAAAQARTAHLAERRYMKALGFQDAAAPQRRENPMTQAGIPGAPPGQGGVQMGAAQQGVEQPIGQAPDGMPIYGDPYHADHSSFTPDHHEGASQLHQQLAEQATAQGRIPTAMEHQMKAAIHGEMGRDAMSPMARMAMDQQGVQGVQASPGGLPQPVGAAVPAGVGGPNSAPQMDAMSQFLTQMPGQTPGMQNQSPNQPPPAGAGAQVAGPKPRMIDNRTGGPLGPQTPPQQHAGTFAEQQPMPPGPAPGEGSMPQIGQGQDDAPPPDGEAEPMDGGLTSSPVPFSWDPSTLDEGVEDDNGAGEGDLGEDNAGVDGEADAPVDEEEDDDTIPDQSPQDAAGPTPGSTESEPGKNAGPSTNDRPPWQQNANKSLVDWLTTI